MPLLSRALRNIVLSCATLCLFFLPGYSWTKVFLTTAMSWLCNVDAGGFRPKGILWVVNDNDSNQTMSKISGTDTVFLAEMKGAKSGTEFGNPGYWQLMLERTLLIQLSKSSSDASPQIGPKLLQKSFAHSRLYNAKHSFHFCFRCTNLPPILFCAVAESLAIHHLLAVLPPFDPHNLFGSLLNSNSRQTSADLTRSLHLAWYVP